MGHGRTSGESFGTPLNRINWGNYDLVVIDESHNFRNNDAYIERETRYDKLMNSVIRDGVSAPIAKTLRPCRNESFEFETTENLFIEGDNLDALKLLQETYLGKAKLIVSFRQACLNDFVGMATVVAFTIWEHDHGRTKA